jgi:hypothetical protein
MSKDKDTNSVINIFKKLSFSAERIPESPKEGNRADIKAEKDNDHFLIEVKSRQDHPELMSDIKGARPLEIVEYEKGLSRSNTLSGIIRKAVSQLIATPDSYNSFKIIWFRSVEALIEDEMSFLKSTLYGINHLIVRQSNGRISHSPCYYFDINEFYKYEDLEGVILDNGQGLELCVNGFSRRISEFTVSSLYNFFSSHNAVTDPLKLEEESKIMVADTQIPRKNQGAIMDYIQKKYRIDAQIINLKSVGGVIRYIQ